MKYNFSEIRESVAFFIVAALKSVLAEDVRADRR
jgi:hypothetical protein